MKRRRLTLSFQVMEHRNVIYRKQGSSAHPADICYWDTLLRCYNTGMELVARGKWGKLGEKIDLLSRETVQLETK